MTAIVAWVQLYPKHLRELAPELVNGQVVVLPDNSSGSFLQTVKMWNIHI